MKAQGILNLAYLASLAPATVALGWTQPFISFDTLLHVSIRSARTG